MRSNVHGEALLKCRAPEACSGASEQKENRRLSHLQVRRARVPCDGVYPIYDIEPQIVAALRTENRLVLSAPTGSGKSTQVPQMLLDHGLAGNGQVVILQPRRIAARLLARRVAEERGSTPGELVGYQVRFENVSSPHTRLLYVTEGVLLRHLLSRPTLEGIGAILFDEFHERHRDGDVMLARALELQRTVRPDLKLVVMSATLDVQQVCRYLTPCETVTGEGRMWPVEMRYLAKPLKPERDRPWDIAAGELDRLLRAGVPGDVLVFMPGAYEIRRTMEAIRARCGAGELALLPLHGELSPQDQDAAVSAQSRRKVVVATNVAETSLTIDGIRIVIDAGLARMARFDPWRGINTLYVEKISQASAEQRAGRAGRTAPGLCLRLWTEREHRERPLKELPEIRRLDLSETLLALKAAGVTDLNTFPWLESPEPASLDRARMLLTDLGAIDPRDESITPVGRRMVDFPLHPRYARMLLAAAELGCVRDAAGIAALAQGRPILIRNPGKPVEARREERLYRDGDASDFFPLLRALQVAAASDFRIGPCSDLGLHAESARQADRLRNQFLRLARQAGLPIEEARPHESAVRRCILAGFVDQLAARRDLGTLRCEVVHGRRGHLSRESRCRDATLLVAAEVHEIERGKGPLQVELSLATAIEEDWLTDLYPEDMGEENEVALEVDGKRVVARRVRRFRDLVLAEKPLPAPPPEEASKLLAREIAEGRLQLPQWNETVEQWILRLNALSRWCPDLAFHPIEPEDRLFLFEQLCAGAVRYRDLKDRPVWPVLKSWLGPGQAELIDRYAPERMQLPCGRRARIRYTEDGPPTLSARIQDLYDAGDSLRIAMGRVALRIEVLAPNQRPVQVTDHLGTFWKETYPVLKKELQRKYPKHEWR